MTWANFRQAFELKYILADVIYIKEQEFLDLRQRNMLVKKFSTKLNLLAKYKPDMANSERGKPNMFIEGQRLNIAKM